MVTARTDAAHIEGTHAVGTAYIELLIIGRTLRVAITDYGAGIDMAQQRRLVGDAPLLDKIGLELDKLGEGVFEHRLVALGPSFAHHGIRRSQQVARLAGSYLPADGVAHRRRAVVGIGIGHLGYKLVAHGHAEIRVALQQVDKRLGLTLHVLIGQYERAELMA